MSVDINTNLQGDNLTISIVGKFDYSAHDDFVASYEDRENISKYNVDMGRTDYLDSSALGMLLLLKDYADSQDAKVVLTNVSDEVRKILDIANFGQIFSIE